MKTIKLSYTYSLYCQETIEVTDDFEFKSIEASDRVDELEHRLKINLVKYITPLVMPTSIVIKEVVFDEWVSIDIK